LWDHSLVTFRRQHSNINNPGYDKKGRELKWGFILGDITNSAKKANIGRKLNNEEEERGRRIVRCRVPKAKKDENEELEGDAWIY